MVVKRSSNAILSRVFFLSEMTRVILFVFVVVVIIIVVVVPPSCSCRSAVINYHRLEHVAELARPESPRHPKVVSFSQEKARQWRRRKGALLVQGVSAGLVSTAESDKEKVDR
jgi:hypothetical protein